MQSPNMKQSLLLLVAIALLRSPLAMAEFTFSSPPRESANAGQELYGPLIRSLSQALGEKVVYVRPNNWAEYASNIRNDKYMDSIRETAEYKEIKSAALKTSTSSS